MKKRVFSGIRATGRLHLGNYLGAVKGMLDLQNDPEYETVYAVVDIHTITTPFHVDELKKNKREIIIDYLAAGLDPDKSIIIRQSDVPQHTELAFYFSTVESVARMQHLPTFKDKVKQHPHDGERRVRNHRGRRARRKFGGRVCRIGHRIAPCARPLCRGLGVT